MGSEDTEIIDANLATYLDKYPGLKELLALRCKACKTYVIHKRRDELAAAKRLTAEITARKRCPLCNLKICEHQPYSAR